MKKILGILLIILCSFSLFSCKDEKTNNPQYEIYELALKSGYTGTYEEWLETIKGEAGKDGREIELDVKDNYIVWRYKGDNTWTKLKAVDELVGSKGETGKSAYEIYLANHPDYSKTEAEWLDDLVNGRLADNGYLLEKEDLYLKLESPYLGIKDEFITTYFYKNGSVPYVGISEMIKSLDGFFNSKLVASAINNETNLATYSYTLNDFEYIMTVDWVDDKIKVNNTDFFTYLAKEPNNQEAYNVKLANITTAGDPSCEYDLGKNHIDIIRYEDDVLIQADVLATMLLSYNLANLVYNGDGYFFYTAYATEGIASQYRRSSKNGNMIPGDLRKATNNGLFFIMNNYYGLAEDSFFDDYEEIYGLNPYIKNNFLNFNPKYNKKGYLDFFIDELDDLHTSLAGKSVYLDSDEDIYTQEEQIAKYSTNKKLYFSTREKYIEDYKKINPDYDFNNPNKTFPMKIEGNTAFIKFNSFSFGGKLNVIGPNGMQDNAWQTDSFSLVRMSLDKLREYNKTSATKVTNVVLDLSHNSGGTISSLVEIAGIMTNDDILMTYMNSQNHLEKVEAYKVDVDLDGDYTDDDAYTDFNYNVLVSELSFSCGNYLPVLVKDMNIAKVIGIHTGGGMCSVGNINLLDGTSVRISSHNQLRSSKRDSNGNLTEVESGIEPDLVLTKDQLWDYKYINELINQNL